MVLKTDKEARLLSASKQFDNGLARYNLGLWDSIMAHNVTLHKDSITLSEDIRGLRAVKAYFQAYIDRYNYQHIALCGAVDEHDGVAFSLWTDKGVTPKDGDSKKDTTIGVFHLRFNSDEKVQEIWFLRQLSKDEAARKYAHVPNQDVLNAAVETWGKGSNAEPGEHRSHNHEHAAAIYNKIWSTGDASLADTIMTTDVKIYNVLFASEKSGLDTFKGMIGGIFKEYDQKDHDSVVAVTAGNKAFNWWSATGVYAGEWGTVFGISILGFDDNDKIDEIITFMQPFPSQRKEMFKPKSEE